MSCSGLIVAAAASGSGKTTITLAILRALRDRGIRVGSAKVGPDYIDPAFLAAATGHPCFNLDSWAMRPETIAATVESAGAGADLLIVEGVMGLFDGAADGTGSTAELAQLTGWPVILVLDVAGQGASAAAVARGFRDHGVGIAIAGVVANRVGGASHRAMIERALVPLGIPLLGAFPRDEGIKLRDRHLGLVQAREHKDLEAILAHAAARADEHLDLDLLCSFAKPNRLKMPPEGTRSIIPLGQRMAIAQDHAFGFLYPHLTASWRSQGAEILPFSPLADEGPHATADAIFLPGGYPELHAGKLASNRGFLEGLRDAAARGAVVYGECGGYMVLGEGLIDKAGHRHAMARLLPLETSFERARLHLGYREVRIARDTPLGSAGATFRGHEFHYASIVGEDDTAPLFSAVDAASTTLGGYGCVRERVMGSFVHLIDRR
ncbi:MAG TPA: cobyrinate a,c-diamide synthase [Alphaproteobacteria bacterium]|nr:cobyrinate a,c-diamide synthase [Alphaproteobacteria bacterium]